jgi:hypothetical protein
MITSRSRHSDLNARLPDPGLPPLLDLILPGSYSGFPLRRVEAIACSSFSLWDFSIERDAPFKSLRSMSPRLADSAAPAAFCWAWDFAGNYRSSCTLLGTDAPV